MFDVSREMGSSVALFSRKVLIQTKATDILPKWLRFLRGLDPPECLCFYMQGFMCWFSSAELNTVCVRVCVQVWWTVRTSR